MRRLKQQSVLAGTLSNNDSLLDQARATVQTTLRIMQGGDDGTTGAPSKQGWTGVELLCRLVTIAAGHNDFRQQFRQAVDGESVALRNLDLHRYLIEGNEQQRRTGLELLYQLSTHVSALQNVRTFFAVTSFADVPGSRLRKSDLLETVMEYILDREMNGGADRPVTDVQSLIIPSETISGVSVRKASSVAESALALPSESYNPATDRIMASDSLQGVLDRLDQIPATTTSTPIKVLAGLLVDRIKEDAAARGEDPQRCAAVLEQATPVNGSFHRTVFVRCFYIRMPVTMLKQ